MLDRAATAIEHLVDISGRAISWLTLLMVVITFTVVVLRYVFDIGWIALQESITYLHAMVFLVGAAYTMQHEGHVRVDIFYSGFNQKTRAWIDLCGALFLLFPFMVFLCWVSWQYVTDSWGFMESSREAGGLPGVYLLKSLILVMAGLLALQATSQIIRALQEIMGDN